MSVNRYIEELVRQDTGEGGHTFVECAADFMKQYESVFAEEFGTDREGTREGRHLACAGAGTGPAGQERRGIRPGHRRGTVPVEPVTGSRD
jgi:hypothetical protein